MSWLPHIFSRRHRYEELSETIREHLEEKIADLMDRGMTREAAERHARREFGNTTLIAERSREVWQWPAAESIFADLKYALRQLQKAPGFSAAVVIILALGIGANTTVFSIVDAVMLRPLPYAAPQRLVEVKASHNQHYESSNICYPDFFDWRAQNHSFEHLLSFHDASYTLTGVERPLRLDGEVVSWEMAATLGVQPELGRAFIPDDEKRGSQVILISHALWKSLFAGDPHVVGKTLRLSGQSFTIVGVMPAAFRFPVTAPRNSFWTTLAVDDDPADPHPPTSNRGVHFLSVIGRLKPGVTIAQADQEMKAITGRLAKQYPDTNTRHNSAFVQSELASVLGDTSTLLMVVLGAVVLVLLIACGNIANLMLARMRTRQREIAMRSALGAGRARIVRQLLVESLLLGLAGGVAGCVLAFVCTPAVLRLSDGVPRAADAGVDLPVLAFALAVSLLSGIIFGIAPALTASRTDLVSTLKEGGRAEISSRDWLRSTVIVGQVALGIVLTAGAGLLITSFVKLTRMDEGFRPDHILTFTFETPDARYKDTRPQFYREYFEKLRALPGVQSAGGSMFLPMVDDSATITFENAERPVPAGQKPSAELSLTSPGFFQTLQVPLIEGRDFTDADDVNAPQVMLVNQAFAQQYFPGEDPIGKKLKPGVGGTDPGKGSPWRTVVGVVGNVRHYATQLAMNPVMYVPASQVPQWCCLFSAVRTSVDPASLEPEVRRLVSSMDSDIPVTDVRTMPELLSLQLSQPRFAMILLSTFAGLALLLTVVGLYGVMAYSVSRRTREIGVRLALGAQRGAVMRMVLGEAAILLSIGIAIGVAVSLASASLLGTVLYSVKPRDPLVLSLVCISVAVAGFLAAYLPSARAASVDPMRALRTE